MLKPRYEYHRPKNLLEVLELRQANPGALLMAGGTDLMVRIRRGDLRPRDIISLRRVEELRGIEQLLGGGLRIGANVTMRELILNEDIQVRFPVLAQAAGRLGSPQIRTSATIGGNLCNASPCADTAPPLLVLEAMVELLSPSGGRDIPLRDFFNGPGQTSMASDEIFGAVKLLPMEEGEGALFMKKGRVRMDLAQASVAMRLSLEGSRCRAAWIAAGSVAPTPVRLEKTEAVLQGNDLSDDLLELAEEVAAGEVSPMDDIRASASYRRQIVGVYVRRAAQELLQGGAQ
jgi:aerobic carbon-monoxide dehydrogenase medium subunit